MSLSFSLCVHSIILTVRYTPKTHIQREKKEREMEGEREKCHSFTLSLLNILSVLTDCIEHMRSRPYKNMC